MLALAPACVTSGTHKKKIAELNKKYDTDMAAAKAREDALLATKTTLQKNLDEATTLVATLTKRLEELGQNVDSLTKEKGQLAASMAETARALEEARKQKAAAEARLATFRNLVAKLRSMIDSGQLKVVIRNGRMIIALPNDILFESGKTEVKAEGKTALAKVAQVLATVPDRDFLIAGHTDDVPIKTSRFPSNWELSTARAVEVVKFLVQNGMAPKVVAATGYAQFDPVVKNDSDANRAQNRRIEIVLQPNLSDLPPLDDVTKS